MEKAKENNAVTVFEATKLRPGDKRKREQTGDPGEIEGYKGGVLYMYLYITIQSILTCIAYRGLARITRSAVQNFSHCKVQFFK